MSQTTKSVIVVIILALVGAGVYLYFGTSESQSNQVRTNDPGKAEMMKSMREGLAPGKSPRPPTGPPSQTQTPGDATK